MSFPASERGQLRSSKIGEIIVSNSTWCTLHKWRTSSQIMDFPMGFWVCLPNKVYPPPNLWRKVRLPKEKPKWLPNEVPPTRVFRFSHLIKNRGEVHYSGGGFTLARGNPAKPPFLDAGPSIWGGGWSIGRIRILQVGFVIVLSLFHHSFRWVKTGWDRSSGFGTFLCGSLASPPPPIWGEGNLC